MYKQSNETKDSDHSPNCLIKYKKKVNLSNKSLRLCVCMCSSCPNVLHVEQQQKKTHLARLFFLTSSGLIKRLERTDQITDCISGRELFTSSFLSNSNGLKPHLKDHTI